MSVFQPFAYFSPKPAAWVLEDVNEYYIKNLPASAFKRIEVLCAYHEDLVRLSASIHDAMIRLGKLIAEYRKEREDMALISQEAEKPRSCPILFSKDLLTYPMEEDESIFQTHMNSLKATPSEKLGFCEQYNQVLKERGDLARSWTKKIYKAICLEIAERQPEAKKILDDAIKEIEELANRNWGTNPSPSPVGDPKAPALSEKRKEPLPTVANPLTNPAAREREEEKKDKPSQSQGGLPSVKRQRS